MLVSIFVLHIHGPSCNGDSQKYLRKTAILKVTSTGPPKHPASQVYRSVVSLVFLYNPCRVYIYIIEYVSSHNMH